MEREKETERVFRDVLLVMLVGIDLQQQSYPSFLPSQHCESVCESVGSFDILSRQRLKRPASHKGA